MSTEKSPARKVYNFFDRLEDKIRAKLSHRPILYTFIGGFAIVLFWRGVWHTTDILEARGGMLGALFSGPGSIIISVAILLLTGLFVSFFVGDVIILSGLKHEKKITEKTEAEIAKEAVSIGKIEEDLTHLESKIGELERMLESKIARK